MGTDELIHIEILVARPDEVWSREQADVSKERSMFALDDVRALFRREPPAESVE